MLVHSTTQFLGSDHVSKSQEFPAKTHNLRRVQINDDEDDEKQRRRNTPPSIVASSKRETVGPSASTKELPPQFYPMQGILYKQGHWNTAWKERYFVQTPRGELEYYETKNGQPRGARLGAIPIALTPGGDGAMFGTEVRAAGNADELFMLDIIVRAPGPSQGRTFVLAAISAAERDEWAAALRYVAEAWQRGVSNPYTPPRAAAAASQRNVLAPQMRGVLDKRGYWNAAWKPRYFIQTSQGELEYFEVEDGDPRGDALGVIPIAMQAGCFGADNETIVRSAGREAGRYLLELTVQGPGPARGRKFVLGAESYKERDDWVAALRLSAEAWRTRNTSSGARAPLGVPPGARQTPSPEEVSAASRRSTPTQGQIPRSASTEGVPGARSADAVGGPKPRSRSEEAVGESDAFRGRPRSDGAAVAMSHAQRCPEGMMHKRGFWNRAWKERYFRLTPRGDLEYYKAPDGAPQGGPAGVIPVALRAGSRGDEEETLVRAGGRDGRLAVIELTVRMAGPLAGRTFVLGAVSGAEHERWVTALQRVAGAWRGEGPSRAPANALGRSKSQEPPLAPRQPAAGGGDAVAAGGRGGMAGPLDKRGHLNKAWKARHFVLTALGVLDYYASESEWLAGERPKGRVPLAMQEGCWGRSHETLINEGGREEGRYVVEIHVQAPGPQCGRIYVLGAPSRELQREWVAALRYEAQAWRRAGDQAASRQSSASKAESDDLLQLLESRAETERSSSDGRVTGGRGARGEAGRATSDQDLLRAAAAALASRKPIADISFSSSMPGPKRGIGGDRASEESRLGSVQEVRRPRSAELVDILGQATTGRAQQKEDRSGLAGGGATDDRAALLAATAEMVRQRRGGAIGGGTFAQSMPAVVRAGGRMLAQPGFMASESAAGTEAELGDDRERLEARRAAEAEQARRRRSLAALLGESSDEAISDPKGTPLGSKGTSGGWAGHLMEGGLDLLNDDATAWELRYFVLSSVGVLHYFASENSSRSGARPLGSVPIAPPRSSVAGAAAVIEEGGWDEGRAVIEVRVRAPGPQRGRVLVLATPAANRSTTGLGAGAKLLADRWVRALRAATGGCPGGRMSTRL
jgi:hypothetical protein